jgi:hypothetical protein
MSDYRYDFAIVKKKCFSGSHHAALVKGHIAALEINL